MERYSELYGTLAGSGGIYSPVKTSANLPKFMNDVGAVNPTATGDAVRKILSGFESKDFDDNYLHQPSNKLPVAVRYAPMHLYKRADMPKSMEAFCALCVNGNENKQDTQDNRVTYYAHTFYIARAHMHEAVTAGTGIAAKTYNYLDQIFGTHLLTHEEVAAIRAGKASLETYEQPEKVNPKMRPQDAAVVFNAVGAVFDEKVVVIRLEKGCAFNDRAWELLIPIYALMPPRLATETGFATYQSLSALRAMTTDTSLRIFVVPAECKLDAAAGMDAVVLDLATPGSVPAPQKGEFRDMLMEWYKLPWEQRQIAMEKVFADTATTYQDKVLFTQRSQEFFSMLAAWKKGDGIERGAIDSLAALKAKYDANPLFAQIPWLKESFVARVPAMLRKGVTLTQLTADALALALYSKDESEKKQAQQMYRFAIELAAADTIKSAQSVGKLVKVQTQEEDSEEMNRIKTAATAAVAAEREKTARVMADAEAAAAQAKADMDAAVAAEQTKTAQVMADAEAAAAQAKADMDAAVAAEQEKTEQVKKVAAEKIKAERENTAKVKADGEAALTSEQNAHAQTQQALAAEQSEHQATRQSLDAEKAARQTEQAQLSEAVQRLEKAKVAYTELKKAKAAVDQELAGVDAKLAEAESLRAEAEGIKSEAERARAKADKIIQENNKRMIIFAAAGFLVAAVIFGVILLVMGLSDKEPVETSAPTDAVVETLPSEPTTEATEEPTTEATTEATEAPTEAPTEPDLTDWSTDAAALWLEEKIVDVDSIVLDPTGVPAELDSIVGYTPVAQILVTEADADAVNYAVLLQYSGEDVDRRPAELDGLPEGGTESDEAAEDTEPEEGGDLTADAAALTAIEVEGARVVLTSQDFVLVIYGGDKTVTAALECFDAIVAEGQQVMTRWTLDDTAWDLDSMLQELLAEPDWWRNVSAVSTGAEALAKTQTELHLEETPVLYLSCQGKEVLFFHKTTSLGAESLADTLLDAGHQAVVTENLVAMIPVV